MNKKQKRKLKRIIISLVCLIVIAVAFKLIDIDSRIDGIAYRLVNIVAYAVPYLIVGLPVLTKAFKNIKNGQVFDENFLMMIATIGAFALGEYTEAAAVMLFYQVGELFENIAVNKSRTAITSLVSLRPDYANIEKDDELVKVDPYDVNVGDVITVLPGERIPLDGEIIDGETYVNTAAITGESVPRRAATGDSIFSGCINEQGKIKIKVTKAFDDSTIAKILDMVENASSRKSKSEGFITRFARVYTPLVVLAAAIVALVPPLFFGGEFADWISRALVFLVISCPCALVISVPLGFFGGIGAASKNGILVKGSNYLEQIAGVGTIVFDKTGTLTEGVFKVNAIKSVSSVSESDILNIAAYGENYSNHPIAKSIEASYAKQGEKIDESRIIKIDEIAGKGVAMLYKGIDNVEKQYYVGNNKLLLDNGIKAPSVEGIGTIVYVADKKECLGYLLISDVIKESTVSAIKRMKQFGIKNTVMLTGDRKETAEAVAREVGIDKVYSELLPQDKLSGLEKILSEKSGKAGVAFVGDGINDAPSLTRADVGIAMGAMGQDAAIEAADIVLMDDNIDKIATVRCIGNKTIRIVTENIVFALGVKLLAMVLGVLKLAGMWFAVFADVGVSVIAILNSTRMLRFKEK